MHSPHATIGEMGVLTMLSRRPWLPVGVFVGVWIVRLRRRSVLLDSDIVRATGVYAANA